MRPQRFASAVLLGILTLAVAFAPAPRPAQAEPFTLAVIPDTQCAVERYPDVVTSMTQWIADNAAKEDIRYVLHVGDMVENGEQEEEWKRFDESMQALDGKVPYAVSMGNHDFDRDSPDRTALFNRYFPPARFKKMDGFGGAYEEDSSANTWHVFEAGGAKWLVLALAYSPNEDVMRWANQVVAEHPDHQAILLTHSYLTHTQRDVAGVRLWNNLVRWHPNFKLVFCGHLSTVHARAEGMAGNTVCEMLFDWQNPGSPDPNSYFALLTIDPEAETVKVRTYSPRLDRFMEGDRADFACTDVKFLPGDPEAAEKALAVMDRPDQKFMISDHSGGGTNGFGTRLRVVDENMRPVMEIEVPADIQDPSILENGNALYGGGGRAVEVTPKGEEVWAFSPGKGKYVTTADRLPGGDTLVGVNPDNVLLEVSPEGEVVQRLELPERFASGGESLRLARKLENGGFLVAHNGKRVVVEYDADGKPVREIETPGKPYAPLRLENGNTLISCGDAQKVVEVDPDGEVVWELTSEDLPGDMRLAWMAGLERLPNGNTVMACWFPAGEFVDAETTPQALEVTPEKEVVWTFGNPQWVGSASNVQILTTEGEDVQAVAR